MNRLVSLLLITVVLALMIVPTVSVAETEVKLHKGLRFGMTGENVYDIEEENFDKVQVFDIDALDTDFYRDIATVEEINDFVKSDEDKTIHFVGGSVAGIPDSELSATFWNNELYCVYYVLRAYGKPQMADYTAIEEALTQSYGNADIVEEDGMTEAHYISYLPEIYLGCSNARFGYFGIYSKITNPYSKYWLKTLPYTMRYIDLNDGSGVLIVHSINNQQDGTLSGHVLEYLYFDAATMAGRKETVQKEYDRNHSINTDEMSNDI